jgi:hypothetical protein
MNGKDDAARQGDDLFFAQKNEGRAGELLGPATRPR